MESGHQSRQYEAKASSPNHTDTFSFGLTYTDSSPQQEISMTPSVLNKYLKHFLWPLLLVLTAGVGADEYVEKTIFLVNEKDRVVAANTQTGQFFDYVLSAKEKIQKRHVANGVAILITNQNFAGVGPFPSGWGTLRRKAGEKIVSVEVQGHSALVVTSDRILTFNGRAGDWSEKRR